MSPWRQRFKWTVYALLFVDFILYLVQDIEYAHYVLDANSDLLEILAAYVTSIDLVAWFALILLFELETYVLVDRDWTGLTKWLVQGVRLVCYVAILHTSFSYDIALSEFHHPREAARGRGRLRLRRRLEFPAKPRLPRHHGGQLQDDRQGSRILRTQRRRGAHRPGRA